MKTNGLRIIKKHAALWRQIAQLKSSSTVVNCSSTVQHSKQSKHGLMDGRRDDAVYLSRICSRQSVVPV